MPADAKLVDLTDHVPHRLKPRIAEFKDLLAVLADEVVVLPVAPGPLIFGVFPAELMAHNQVALDEKLQGVVHGGPADRDFLPDEPAIQFIRVKVTVNGIHLVQDGEALRRMALFSLRQERLKNAPDLVLLRWRGLHRSAY